eukprot:2973-Pelagococcus_subviridis.AAC.1
MGTSVTRLLPARTTPSRSSACTPPPAPSSARRSSESPSRPRSVSRTGRARARRACSPACFLARRTA